MKKVNSSGSGFYICSYGHNHPDLESKWSCRGAPRKEVKIKISRDEPSRVQLFKQAVRRVAPRPV